MWNNYQYIDPDYAYTDPATGVLRNIGGVGTQEDLIFIEGIAFLKRSNELIENPLKIKDTETLLVIHHHLFQDIYEWAGKVRTVEISKQGKQFFPSALFGQGFAYIDSLIADYRKIDTNDIGSLAELLAIVLDSLNFLHPFREGNGRAQREFIRLLALEKGYRIDLNPSDNSSVFARYMSGTINSNIPMLYGLIFELLTKEA